MDWQVLMLESLSKDEFECACGVQCVLVGRSWRRCVSIIWSSGDDCNVRCVALVAPFTLLL